MNKDVKVQFQFQGHYDEKDLTISIPRSMIKEANNTVRVQMIFNPYLNKGTWELVMGYSSLNIPLDPIEITNQLPAEVKAKPVISNKTNKIVAKKEERKRIN